MTDTTEPLPATKDRLGAYDAIETAKPGEPLFPIQGGDPLGPRTVQFWADEARKLALETPPGAARDKLLRKASDADGVGWAMLAYQRGEEAQADQRATYNDQAAPEIDTAQAVRVARIKAVGKLHNAIGIIAAEVEALQAVGYDGLNEPTRLGEVVERLQAITRDLEPRRGSERS